MPVGYSTEFYPSSLKSFILRSISVVLSCSANGGPAGFSGTDWSFGLAGTDWSLPKTLPVNFSMQN